MATSYGSDSAGAVTGSAFTLPAGSSRQFYCEPPLGGAEAVTLEISSDSGTTWTQVGTVCSAGNQAGVVTAQGNGSSYFRCNKTTTEIAKQMWYD